MSKIEDTVVELIQKSVSSVEQGISWISGELPDVIHQFLMWKLAASILFIVLWCIGAFIWSRYCAEYKRIEVQNSSNRNTYNAPIIDTETYETILILSGLVMSVLFFGVVVCGFTILQILIAPKIYLIEYAASLVK